MMWIAICIGAAIYANGEGQTYAAAVAMFVAVCMGYAILYDY